MDCSCYAIPSPASVQSWVASVPAGFTFHFKAFGLFCSQSCVGNALPRDAKVLLPSCQAGPGTVKLADMPEEAVDAVWRRFHAAIEPARKVRLGTDCPFRQVS